VILAIGVPKKSSIPPRRQLQRRGVVRYWADFLKAKLEPRSVWQLPGLWEGAASFQGYGSGREALGGGGSDAREAVTDRIRWFAEECDQMQAIAHPFSPNILHFLSQIVAVSEDCFQPQLDWKSMLS